jgi:RNA polymerase sigma factor (sigma-70 family)
MEIDENELLKLLGWIEGYCCKWATRGSAQWQDLVSVAVQNVVEKSAVWNPNKMGLIPFLYEMAKQGISTHFQSQNSQKRKIQFHSTSYDQMLEDGWEPKQDAIYHNTMDLEEALTKLSELEHAFVIHRHQEGLGLQEIADTYRMSPYDVAKIEARGLEKLKRFMS